MGDVSMQDGIYFGMDEALYHSIPRLSASGVKELRISSLKFWFQSWMNPNREEDKDTPARKLGRAYHKLFLEGDAAFDASYAVAPSKDDYPNALDGGAELKAKCEELGLKKSGTIAELCDRLRQEDYTLELWPDIMAEFEQECGEREVLSRSQWEEIQRARYVLNHMPEIADIFTGGQPEVTILFTDGGVPMKARLDYLKPGAGLASIVDLKSFGNVMGKPIEDVPEGEISRNDYFVQPVVYSRARKAARQMWADHGIGCVHTHDDGPDEDWIASVLEPEKSEFVFVFVQTGGVPDIAVVEFVQTETYGGMGHQLTEHWKRGRDTYRYGLTLFRRCMEQYGEAIPWVAHRPRRKLSDVDFPPWALSQNIPDLNDEVPS
jgi:hypothetical protein